MIVSPVLKSVAGLIVVLGALCYSCKNAAEIKPKAPDLPELTIAGSEVNEGDSIEFHVHLSTPSTDKITFNIQLEAGTADASDYAGDKDLSVITFGPGITDSTFRFPSFLDTLKEQPETILMVLSEPTNATITTDKATSTIDDVAAQFYLYAVIGGNPTITFTSILADANAPALTDGKIFLPGVNKSVQESMSFEFFQQPTAVGEFLPEPDEPPIDASNVYITFTSPFYHQSQLEETFKSIHANNTYINITGYDTNNKIISGIFYFYVEGPPDENGVEGLSLDFTMKGKFRLPFAE